MITREEYEILKETINIFEQKCKERIFCDGCDLESICNTRAPLWDVSKIELDFIITDDEYVILKNMDCNTQNFFLCRDKSNCLYLFTILPVKHSDEWGFSYSVGIGNAYRLYGFEHIFKRIKWEDEEPKRISDYIKEYEEIHGL